MKFCELGLAYSHELDKKQTRNRDSSGTSPTHMQLPTWMKASCLSLHLQIWSLGQHRSAWMAKLARQDVLCWLRSMAAVILPWWLLRNLCLLSAVIRAICLCQSNYSSSLISPLFFLFMELLSVGCLKEMRSWLFECVIHFYFENTEVGRNETNIKYRPRLHRCCCLL